MGKFVLPPPNNKCVENFETLRSYIFDSFEQITFKLGFFQRSWQIFPNLSISKAEKKNVGRS